MHTLRLLVFVSILLIIQINPIEAYASYPTMLSPQDLLNTRLPHDMLPDPETLLTTIDDQLMFVFNEEGLLPAWITLIHSLSNEDSDKSLVRNFVDPVFGFSSTILFQSMNKLSSPNISFSIPSKIPVILAMVRTNFKLTKQILKQLEDEGIPEELLEELLLLQDQEFSEEDTFLNALEGQIGGEETARYQQLFLKHASVESSIPGAKTSQNKNLYIASAHIQNMELWYPIIYRSLVARRLLLSKNSVRIKRPRKAPLEEQDDLFFKIIAFFKDWGVPTPLAIVLFIVGVYLVLAFFARK